MKSGLLTFLLFFCVSSMADWVFYATGDDATLYWYENKKSILKKNDVVLIGVDEGEITFYKNNEIMAQTQNIKLAKIIFLPWIGKKPITKNCKKHLFKFAT